MKKRTLSLILMASLVVAAMTGCGNKAGNNSSAPAGTTSSKSASNMQASSAASTASNSTSSTDEVKAAAAPDEQAGFTEIPIFENQKVDFLNVSAVYFQPVPMAPGQEDIKDFNLHLECDISALENDLGYGVGDWVPYLTIDYKVIGSDKKVAAEGTFMEMSASDGPHYGVNLKLDKADTYSLEFTIHSPAERGYLIHSDSETGPGGLLENHFKDGNLKVTYEGWGYTPQSW